MTEERMIIILDEEGYCEKYPDGVACIDGWFKYEPAPPKDWVPACIGGLKYRNEPECAGCIYQSECKRA